jgi:SAM-dependent methyltransferase
MLLRHDRHFCGTWRSKFVRKVYADHDDSPEVRRAIKECLDDLQPNEIGLQIGSAGTRLHPSVLNLDLVYNSHLDCCARAESLPFKDECFSLELSQEVLEHVQDLPSAVREMYRVLREGGRVYCQVPFTIGYHPGPTDFWRFTREGIREIFEQAGFVFEDMGITVGPCVGWYRITIEFTAVLAGGLTEKLYYPVKALMALLLYPIKLLDPLLLRTKQADRIAGGYFVIMRKPQTH